MVNKQALGMITVAVIGAGASWLAVSEAVGISKKVGMAVDELAKCTTVDVEKALVEKAVQKAVDREASAAVKMATDEVIRGMRTTYDDRVRTVVDTAYKDVESTVADKLAGQVAKIDENQLRMDVSERAKIAVMGKLDGCLNQIVSDFRSKLAHVNGYANPNGVSGSVPVWSKRQHAKGEKCVFDGQLWVNKLSYNDQMPCDYGWEIIE